MLGPGRAVSRVSCRAAKAAARLAASATGSGEGDIKGHFASIDLLP